MWVRIFVYRLCRPELTQTSESGGMSGTESPPATTFGVPSRANIAAISEIRSVEPQSCDQCKRVTPPAVDRDPPAAAAFAIPEKITGWKRLTEGAGRMQSE